MAGSNRPTPQVVQVHLNAHLVEPAKSDHYIRHTTDVSDSRFSVEIRQRSIFEQEI